LNWALNRPGQLWAPDESQQRSPGPELNGRDDPNVHFRCQCQGDKKAKEKKKTCRDIKKGSRILLCLPLM
jgi:hypothetical protein